MIKDILYEMKIIFYKRFLNRDTMELEIIKYRKKGVRIGENMRAFSPPYSAEPYLLEFGNNITISTGVNFTTHDNSVIKIIPNSTDIFGRIKIGDNCFIGQNSLILPGVTITNNVIIAAGSVVTKSFYKEGIIIGGNPAREIGSIEEFSKKYNMQALSTKGLNFEEKKAYLLNNEEKFIVK